jgi:RNA recognition motif-containing protein
MIATVTLHVGNLPFTATEHDLRALVAPHAEPLSVTLVIDRETGRPRGFGFVTIAEAGSQSVIDALQGCSLQERPLRISLAQERQRLGGGPFRR